MDDECQVMAKAHIAFGQGELKSNKNLLFKHETKSN